ncbi:MAG TPA: glycosyltransferase [Anaeromyxobacteraceae bacterium]|nr:glycosyltransferase [Anaeromyxobacteraceae bacterium]
MPDPLHVCLLHDYREHRQTSMRLYAEHLGDALAGRGVRVERVRPPEVLPERLRRPWALDRLDSYWGRFVRYPRTARRLRADVYHVVDHGQGHLVLHLDPARTVVTCHDVILLALAAGRIPRGPRPPRVATAILRRAVAALGRARLVVAVSENTRRDLAELAGIDPAAVRVIPPGLNYPFRPDPGRRGETRRRLGLPAKAPVVLHVGQTGFYKNVEGCLQVVARLRAGGLDTAFVRAGQPLRPAQVALAARLGVAGAVHDLGPLPSDDLAALYAAADVLLFPSLYEGFGWPPLEAMASGLPVVSSRAGGLEEVVGDAALTAEPEDDAQLAEHVAAALTVPRVAEGLRVAGAARAAGFGWARTAGLLLDAYRALAET